MEASEAGRFLEPRTLVLTIAACAPTIVTFPLVSSTTFIPTLHTLLSYHTSLLHSSRQLPALARYDTLLHQFQHVQVHADDTLLQRLGVSSQQQQQQQQQQEDGHAQGQPQGQQHVHVDNVAKYIHCILSLCITSPHALYLILDLAESQLDASANAVGATQNNPLAYEHTSLICLFLRKVVIAFHSIGFECLSKLYTKLNQFITTSTSITTTTTHNNISANDDNHIVSPYILSNLIQSVACGNQTTNIIPLLTSTYQTTTCTITNNHDIVIPYIQPHVLSTVCNTLKQYLLYFYSLYTLKDYSLSFEYLHRYFDQIQRQQQHQRHSKLTTLDSTSCSLLSPSGYEEGEKIYEYSILGLSITYMKLNNHSGALLSLQDSFRYSNLINDHDIRTHSLRWISYIEHTNINKRHLLFQHAKDLLNLKIDLFHTVFTPSPSPSLSSSPSASPTSSFNLNASSNRMKLIFPVLSKDKNHNKIEQLMLITNIRMELGDLLTALMNIKLAIKLCKQPQPQGENSQTNLKSIYIQCKIIQAIIYFDLGHLKKSVFILSKLLYVLNNNNNNNNNNNGRHLLDPCLEQVQYTLTYIKFHEMIRKGYIHQARRYKKTLASNTTTTTTATNNANKSCTQNDLKYVECEMMLHSVLKDYHRSYEYNDLYIRQSAYMNETKKVIHGKLLTCMNILQISDGRNELVRHVGMNHALGCICLSEGFDIENQSIQSHLTFAQFNNDSNRDNASWSWKYLNRKIMPKIYTNQLYMNGVCSLVWCHLYLQQQVANNCDMDVEQVERRIIESGIYFSHCQDLKAVAKCWYVLARLYHHVQMTHGSVRKFKKKRNNACKRYNEIIQTLKKRSI